MGGSPRRQIHPQTQRPRRLRLVYLATTGPLGPSSRYRIYQYLPFFDRAGIEVRVLPAFSDRYLRLEAAGARWRRLAKAGEAAIALARRLAQLLELGSADGVIIERELFPWTPPVVEWLLRRYGRGYVLELDDAVYLARGRRLKYPATLRMARAVIAGNEALAEVAGRHNRNVAVIPTTVDPSRYEPRADYALGAPPRIGWVGLPFNFGHLAAVEPALARVCAASGARLVVVSARLPSLRVPMELVPWSVETEAGAIRHFDVGVMPLADTPFARGKCGLKLLQYMAAGVPAVASPVGVNAEIIRPGDNGLLAATPTEWEASLLHLLADEQERRRLGRAGRATVEAEYSTAVWGERLVQHYAGLFGCGSHGRSREST